MYSQSAWVKTILNTCSQKFVFSFKSQPNKDLERQILKEASVNFWGYYSSLIGPALTNRESREGNCYEPFIVSPKCEKKYLLDKSLINWVMIFNTLGAKKTRSN